MKMICFSDELNIFYIIIDSAIMRIDLKVCDKQLKIIRINELKSVTIKKMFRKNYRLKMLILVDLWLFDYLNHNFSSMNLLRFLSFICNVCTCKRCHPIREDALSDAFNLRAVRFSSKKN